MSRPNATTLRPVDQHTSGTLHPRVPTTLAEAGLSQDLVTQLVLKLLHFGAEQTGSELARKLGLEFSVIEPALDFLKRSHQCEDSAASWAARPYRYRITDAGRTRAAAVPRAEPVRRRRAGAARAVPRATWTRFQGGRAAAGHARPRSAKAFSHLVIGQRVLDQLGPAINAGHSMFVYGPPGNGKTVISQAIHNLLRRRHRHSARARGRRQHHPVVRSGQSRAAA